MSFYTLFSLAPITIIAVGVAGIFFGKEAATKQFSEQMSQLVGNASAQVIQKAMEASALEDIGRKIQSLWTGTSCVGAVPSRLFDLPVIRCTKEQFLAEVKAQIMSCQSLNALVKEANDGRDLADFKIAAIEVWHEWIFSAEGIRGPQPKWVTTTNTHPYLPRQITPVPNLLLAGAHTRTEVDVWSIEGAVESGRRAAQAIDPGVKILPQFKPLWLRVISMIDDACYAVGAPHVLDLFGVGCLVVSVGTLALWIYFLAQHR